MAGRRTAKMGRILRMRLRSCKRTALQYAALFLLWAVALGVGTAALGIRLSAIPARVPALYVAPGAIYFLGQWDQAAHYNLEPPLVALGLGLLISNTVGAPRWLEPGLRVEFYIKTGIVLLGAGLPLTLIAWAGPVAIVQAAIVSLATFGVIYFSALRLGLDRRLAATLGHGRRGVRRLRAPSPSAAPSAPRRKKYPSPFRWWSSGPSS